MTARSINVTRTYTHTLTGTQAVSSGAFNDRTRTASAGEDFRFIFHRLRTFVSDRRFRKGGGGKCAGK